MKTEEQLQLLLNENASLRRMHTDAHLQLDGLKIQFLQLKAQYEALQRQFDAIGGKKTPPKKKKK